jgi:hypothetical protein
VHEFKNKMGYKRPTFRPHGCYKEPRQIFPTAPGFLAQICTPSVPVYLKPEWTPPVEYKFIAKFMSAEEGADYIARCEAWFEAHPPRAVREATARVELDYTPVHALRAKYPTSRPPLEESIEAWRAAGQSEEKLEKYRKWWQRMEETDEQRQKALDDIFKKYPSANKSSRVNKPKKIIRAVKKKMTVED